MYYLPNARFRPIEQWPGKLRHWTERERSRFRAPWSKTLTLLRRELEHLDARTIVLQVAMREGDIRQDGYPRANAKAEHPGVILAFESRHGPLSYAVDTYDDWQDNIRAIALALEALRAVDRYGVTRRGEQYRGWQAIEAPANGKMTAEQAARFIAEQSGIRLDASEVRQHGGMRADAYRAAARRLHPDAGGSHEAFTRLQEAKRVLDETEAR
jgi:hypothetical protein